jgi:hypothetical protein
MLEIKSSLDWSSVETEIKNLGNMLPMFKNDIKKICDTIRPEISKLSSLEVEHRRIHSTATNRYCQQQVQIINERLKLFQKFYLMALLAQ